MIWFCYLFFYSKVTSVFICLWRKSTFYFPPLSSIASYFEKECPGSSEVSTDVSALAPLRPVCMYSLQNNWSLEKSVALQWTLSPILQCPEDCQRGPFPMSKPLYFSSMGGVFLILKIISFSHSHSMCVYTLHAAVSSMPACHTDTISLWMPLPSFPQDRVGKSPDFAGTGERWTVFFFACDTLFPFTSKRFFQCCLLGTRCCSGLELPWLLVLGSWTALIQFTTHLHNCSQSPVDLDVKQRSSCTNPEKGGGSSGRALENILTGVLEWNAAQKGQTRPVHSLGGWKARLLIFVRWMLSTFRAHLCPLGLW